MTKSIIGSFYTLSACIDQIPNLINNNWIIVKNKEQEKFITIYRNTTKAKIPEIESKVSVGDSTPVNEFLKSKRFDIKLSQATSDKDVAIASVLDLVLAWLKNGNKSNLYYDKTLYKAVELDKGVSIHTVYGFDNPIAKIVTKNDDIVLMTVLEDVPKDGFDVYFRAKVLMNHLEDSKIDSNYLSEVTFPYVKLDVQPDISWLNGLTNANGYSITQALMQTKLDIDDKGVKVKEAVSIMVTLSSFKIEPEPLRIDRPFLFTILRKGLKEPLFSAYVDTDGWIKNE